MTDLPEYILERLFDAPRDLVWQAWTDPALLNRWYGPGADTVIHEFDLRPGGVWLGEMRWGEKSMFSKVTFQEVDKGRRMVWHHCASDAEWNVTANPMMPNWPRTLLTEVRFEDQDGKTQVRLSQTPLDASDAEITCFAKMMANMDGGWASGYRIIDDILAELQA